MLYLAVNAARKSRSAFFSEISDGLGVFTSDSPCPRRGVRTA
jgi:hypothetical protein